MTRNIVWTHESCACCHRPAYIRKDNREYLYTYDGSLPVCSPKCARKLSEIPFQPMRIHKRIVISWLESHPEDAATLLPPEWQGRLEEYLEAMRKHPAEFIVDGELREGN